MDKYMYQCNYCGNQYKPNRRFKQRFCSNSCRVNSHIKNKKKNVEISCDNKEDTNKPLQIDKISLAGIGNAAVGTLAVNALTSIFTSEENKPATKKDIRNLEAKLSQRYYPVKNLPPQQNGLFPVFDIQSNTLVYLKKTNTKNYGGI